jgi:DUF971 family protein
MEDQTQPVALRRVGEDQLEITWSDQRVQQLRIAALRQACPCAACKEKKKGGAPSPSLSLPVLSAAEAQPLRLLQMTPVGNYAYHLRFSDQHDSGIYSFALLRSLDERPRDSKS